MPTALADKNDWKMMNESQTAKPIPLFAKQGWPSPSKRMMPKATKVGADGVVSPRNVFGMRFETSHLS